MQHFGRAEFEAASDAVRQRTQHQPRVGLVLGSGLGGLADSVENPSIIPYEDIPHWPKSTVPGHSGKLVLGKFENQDVLMMQGRAHYYEGYSLTQVTLPIRVMQLLGVEIVILTNAAGGINKSYQAGDLMLIADHINLVGMTSENPLKGPNDDSLGPRFPGMNGAYDPALRAKARKVAKEEGVPLHEGVYVGLSGPSFETPAEIRFLRAIGADAVGMSTVHEAIVARHGRNENGHDQRLRVLGISGITNATIDDSESPEEATHEEVLDAGKVLVPRLEAVVRGVLRTLSDPA
jgi:purine-nucleoside phosphorylase